MSKQDIEKRLGFAAQGVKATFAEFNVGDKVVYVPDNHHIDAYGRIIKIENGIATIASAEGNVKAKLSDLELVKKGSVEDLRRLGMKGFARPGVKAEFYASPEHLPMILAKTRKMHEDSKKAAEKYLQSGSVANQGGAAGLANSMVNSLERDLKNDLYRLTQSRNPVHKKAAKEAYAEIKAMADWWYSQYKKWTAARPGVKAEMALTISTVGAKNLCYEALANLGELTKLAAQTNSGWDFHVNVMINHVKDAIARMETKPTQAATDLDKAVDTLGMLKKIEPKRLNDIQKGSFKQLIGYVAKSLRDAKANIKLVTTASRPGVKAKFDTKVGSKGNKSAMIAKNGPDADASWLAWVVQHHGEGQGESVLGTMRSYSTEARAKAAALRGLETSGLRGGFSRPGVKATFALRVPELETLYSSLGASGQAITDKPSARKDRALLLKLDAEYSQPTDTVMVALNAAKLYRQLSAGSKATPQGQKFQQRLEIAGGHRFARPTAKAKMAAEIASDPRDKDFEKLKTLKGVVHQGKGFYIIPGKLMTPERRTKVKRSTQRYELSNMGDLVGWGTNHPNVNDYRLKDWAEAFA